MFRSTDSPDGCGCRWSPERLRPTWQADARRPYERALSGAGRSGDRRLPRGRQAETCPQGPKDPFPGYYISQTAFADAANHNERDPRSYVDARNINYVVRGDEARRRGVKVGDFVAVYSKRSQRAVFAIVGDTGNPTGDEGSLHLLQELGYPFHDGRSDSVTRPEIIVRFFPNSNPKHMFFFTQGALDEAATKLALSRDFPHIDGMKAVSPRAACQ